VLVGGDTGESAVGGGRRDLVRAWWCPCGGAGGWRNGAGGVAGRMLSTLLGPEGTTRPVAVAAGGCCFGARHDLGGIPVRVVAVSSVPGCWCFRVGCGLVVG